MDDVISELSFEECIGVSHMTGDGEGSREYLEQGGTRRRKARDRKVRVARD